MSRKTNASSSRTVHYAIQKVVRNKDFMALAGTVCRHILNLDNRWLPDPYWLDRWLEQRDEHLRKIIEQILSSDRPKPEHLEIKLDFFFGPNWPGHALRHRQFFWHRPLQEPDITKLLVETMRYESKHASRQWLCRAFLLAVCRASGQDEQDYAPDKDQHVQVSGDRDDAVTEENERIDLLFQWGENENTRLVAIEAKFDARLTNNLGNYETHLTKMQKQAGGRLPPLKILLVKNSITQEYEGWLMVFWQELLSLWEKELKKLSNESPCHVSIDQSLIYGAQLRASIIQKVYGGIYV